MSWLIRHGYDEKEEPAKEGSVWGNGNFSIRGHILLYILIQKLASHPGYCSIPGPCFEPETTERHGDIGSQSRSMGQVQGETAEEQEWK